MQEATGFQRQMTGQYSANVGAWLASSAWAHRWWVPYLTNPSEGLFPGILAIVLGLWGGYLAIRLKPDQDSLSIRLKPDSTLPRDVAWFYIGLAVFTLWLTFGPDAGLYALLYNTVPVFSFLRAPSRAGIVVTLCLVILAAVAMKALMERKPGVAFAALLFLVTADLYRAPLRTREAPPLPAVFNTLARLPRGPVIELPYWSQNVAYHRHAEYMLLSTYHWQPLVNGYSDHIPQDFRDNALPLSGFPSRDSLAILEPIGARYAVFHLNLFGENDRASLISRIENDYAHHLRPLEKDGDVWLYEIIWPR